MRTKKFWTPTSIIWALVHFMVCIVGYSVINLPSIQAWIGEASASGIGASLIAGGVTGLLLYIYVWFSDDIRQKLELLSRAGLVRVFDARSTRIRDEYDSRVQSGKSIDILGFGLSQFREDHGERFREWSQSKKIRIIVLDPSFPSEGSSYASQRSKEEGNHTDKISTDITEFIEFIRRTQDINEENFQVKYMKALPSINIFRIDGEIFWGPYLMSRQSRNTLTMLCVEGGFMYKQLSEHFESLWSNASFSAPAR